MTAGAMKLLLLLPVLYSAAVQAETNITITECSDSQWSYEDFLLKLKMSTECGHTAQWTETQNATILNYLNQLVDTLKKNKSSACRTAVPKECPTPAVHSKGGVVCVSVQKNHYCKPMCNKSSCESNRPLFYQYLREIYKPFHSAINVTWAPGYDFSFLRISRLYEECSSATRYQWTTQYVGGNKLAVCDKSSFQIVGAPSAYFPDNQDCWTTKSNSVLEKNIITTFEKELADKNIGGPYTHSCLMCG